MLCPTRGGRRVVGAPHAATASGGAWLSSHVERSQDAVAPWLQAVRTFYQASRIPRRICRSLSSAVAVISV